MEKMNELKSLRKLLGNYFEDDNYEYTFEINDEKNRVEMCDSMSYLKPDILLEILSENGILPEKLKGKDWDDEHGVFENFGEWNFDNEIMMGVEGEFIYFYWI